MDISEQLKRVVSLGCGDVWRNLCYNPSAYSKTTFWGDNCAIQVTVEQKIAIYFCELRGKNLKNVSEGCLAMGKGNTRKIFRVPGRTRTHDLHNAGRLL